MRKKTKSVNALRERKREIERERESLLKQIWKENNKGHSRTCKGSGQIFCPHPFAEEIK